MKHEAEHAAPVGGELLDPLGDALAGVRQRDELDLLERLPELVQRLDELLLRGGRIRLLGQLREGIGHERSIDNAGR